MTWVSSWIEYFPQLLGGLWVSLLITVIALAIGLPAGLGLAMAAMSGKRLPRILSLVVVEFGRGAPALVILQMAYFGLASVGLVLTAITAACAAFVFATAAYTSEIFRAGLQAVPHGELEASDALGLSMRDRMRFVVLPQGIRIAIPSLVGIAILTFQATSLAYTIAVRELLAEAYSIGSSNFDYLTVLALAGVMYAAVSIPATWLTVRLEKRLALRT